MCLFSILYFFVPVAQPGQGRFGRRFAAFCGQRRAGGGAEFLLFCCRCFLEVQESKGGLFDFTFSLTPQFNLLQLPLPAVLRQLFLERCHQRSAQHLLRRGAGAAGAAVLLRQCAPAGKSWALPRCWRRWRAAFWVKGVDQIWHGMKQPVWFPYRYSFLFSAVVILLAARVLTAGPQRRRAWGWPPG